MTSSTQTHDLPGATAEELLPGSAATWRAEAPQPRIPDALRIDTDLPPAARLAAWRERHRIRGERARHVFADSRAPERGLPVARASRALGFVLSRAELLCGGLLAVGSITASEMELCGAGLPDLDGIAA